MFVGVRPNLQANYNWIVDQLDSQKCMPPYRSKIYNILDSVVYQARLFLVLVVEYFIIPVKGLAQ